MIDELQSKHPDVMLHVPGDSVAFEEYDEMGRLVEIDCTEEIVEKIAG